jgi:hypothetical protein
MLKLIKSMFSKRTQLEQKENLCSYLDQLQLNVLKGVK